MKTSAELLQERAAIWEQAKKLLDATESESRDFSPEEQEQWEKMNADMDELKKRADRLHEAERMNAHLESTYDDDIIVPDLEGNREGPNGRESRMSRGEARVLHDRAVRGWILEGTSFQRDEFVQAAERLGVQIRSSTLSVRGLSGSELPTVEQRLNTRELTKAVKDAYIEKRDILATGGGVADELMASLEIALLAFGGMRRVSRVVRTTDGADMPVPSWDDTANTGELVAEAGAHTLDVDPTIANTVLQGFKYGSGIVQVSIEMLQDESINLESVLGEALGTRIGRITNTHFTTGDGTSKPKGVITATSTGVTGGTGVGGTFTFDNLVDLEHSVDAAYRNGPSTVFMMRDATVADVKQLKDSNSRPIWLPSLVPGTPDTLLGWPIVVNNDMAAVAVSAASVAFGNFSYYWIRDAGPFMFQRLNELYAANGLVAFLAMSRHDGDMPVTGAVKKFIGAAT